MKKETNMWYLAPRRCDLKSRRWVFKQFSWLKPGDPVDRNLGIWSTESIRLHIPRSSANDPLLHDSSWLLMTPDIVKDLGLHHSPPLEKDSTSNLCSIVMERLGNLLFSFSLERNMTRIISNPFNSFPWTPISTTMLTFSLNLQLIFMGFSRTQ